MSDLNNIIETQMNLQKEAANEALNEYLENLNEIDTKKHLLLKDKLKADPSYEERFQTGLMEMSLLISAAMVVSNDNEFLKIQKKVLFEARHDDDMTQDMRLFYAQTITADELSKLLTTEEERNLFTDRMQGFLDSYKELKSV